MDPLLAHRIFERMEDASLEDRLRWMLTRGSVVPAQDAKLETIQDTLNNIANYGPRDAVNDYADTRSTRPPDPQDSRPGQCRGLGSGKSSTVFGQDPEQNGSLAVPRVVKLRPSARDSDFSPFDLEHEASTHRRIAAAFSSLDISVRVPSCCIEGYAETLAPQFDDLRCLIDRITSDKGDNWSLWQSTSKLVMDRILPLPKPTRLALMRKYAREYFPALKFRGTGQPGLPDYCACSRHTVVCPSQAALTYDQVRACPRNRDCLVRPLLGSHHYRSDRAVAEPFSLRNFALHFFDLFELGMAAQMAWQARSMAEALAVMHWECGCDARGVEFVLGGKKEGRGTVTTELYLFDFDKVRVFGGLSRRVVGQLADAFLEGDKYWPRPQGEYLHGFVGYIWGVFEERYLWRSRVILEKKMSWQMKAETRRELAALPALFIETVKERLAPEKGRNNETCEDGEMESESVAFEDKTHREGGHVDVSDEQATGTTQTPGLRGILRSRRCRSGPRKSARFDLSANTIFLISAV